MIGLGAVGFLLLYFYYNLDPNEHGLFRLIITLFIPLLFVLMAKLGVDISSGLEYETTALNFYKLSMWFLRLYYTYFFIYLFYKIFSYFKTIRRI